MGIGNLATKRKAVIAAAYVYLTLPVCIFFIGWLKPVISLPMTLLFLYGTVISVKNFNTSRLKAPAITARQMIIVALMIMAWVLLAGVGGFVWQNRYDHVLRNAVFQDLVNFDWPVVNEGTNKMICYYFGFWMPAALVGKAFGIEAGYVFQLIWAMIGTGLAFCLMSYILGKFSWVTMLIFIFFSGLDIVPAIINALNNGLPALDAYTGFGRFFHMELQFTYFNSSSNTSMLFWMYNYTVPYWVGFMLILLQKNNRSLWFTYSLLALFAPIPMVGTLPAVIYISLHNEGITLRNIDRKIGTFLKNQLNIQNIAGIAQALIVTLFLKTNNSAGNIGTLPVSGDMLLWFLYFFMIEFGIYLLVLFPSWTKNRLCIVMMFSAAVLSFVVMGGSYDFAWRTTTPFMLFLMLFIMKRLIVQPQTIKRAVKIALIVVMAIGAVNPMVEMGRSVYNTAVIVNERQNPGAYAEGSYEHDVIAQFEFRNDWIPTYVDIEGDEYDPIYHNFISTDVHDTLFNKYLRK